MLTPSGFEKYVTQPEPHDKIWRYMDFTEYLWLLEKKSLFCAQLKHFEDKYEGSFSLYLPNNYRAVLEADEVSKMGVIKAREYYRTQFAASCWHINDNQSAALWKLYLSSNEGIAVQTTVERLLKSLTQEPHLKGKVLYVPHSNWDGVTESVSHVVPFLKRPSFAHEHEYRIVYQHVNMDESGGIAIPVGLEILIETLYIAPSAKRWFVDFVKEMTKKYALPEPIHSDLDNSPLF